MLKRKPKAKRWNPGRPTIKGLQDRIMELERLLVQERSNCTFQTTQRVASEARLKIVAAENESLLSDKKWLKLVIQDLLPSSNKAHRMMP